jgi:hypothetical protein
MFHNDMSNILVTFTSAAGQVRLRMPRSVVMVEIADDADTSTAVHVQTTIRRPGQTSAPSNASSSPPE